MQLTPEQQQAAWAKGSVVVVAGAGTGKTQMLSERYLHHLRNELSPLEIVAVTFTEKAAAELRSRIREKVSADPDGTEELLAELEAAQIGTIHSIAARICREHFEVAGVNPNFSILDKLTQPLWLTQHLEESMAQLSAHLFEELPWSLMLSALGALLADPLAAEEALAQGAENWPALVEQLRLTALHSLVQSNDWQRAVEVLASFSGAVDDKREQMRKIALVAAEEFAASRNLQALDSLCAIDLRGGSTRKWLGGGFEEVKGALDLLRSLAREARDVGLVSLVLSDVDTSLERKLTALSEAFHTVRRRIEQIKRAEGILDFSDLEVHALRALEHPDVREYYAKRWQAYLVDEFQDTNPVQAKLLEQLAGDAVLTIVGDQKQAIYGFRRADVRVFERFQLRISGAGGDSVILTRSFRTHALLMEQFNSLFEPLLGTLHQPLEAARTESLLVAPYLEAYGVEPADNNRKVDRQWIEARHIAAKLKALLESGAVAGPGGIAILTRTWDPLDVYGEALSELDIPSVHAGGGNLLTTREAADGLALLRFLADPFDDLALATLLRSPLFALSDRVLLKLVETLPAKASWWLHMGQTTQIELVHATRILKELLDACSHQNPAMLLRSVDRLCGYSAVIANLENGRRRLADWQAFIALVFTLEGGLRECSTVLRRIDNLLQAEQKVPRPPLEAVDAVSLMTIHAAKGLEWSVVVVADLARRPPSSTPAVLVDPDLGIALTWREDTSEKLRPALYKILECQKEQREREETARLLYVALTRARDSVILSASDLQGGSLNLLEPGLLAAQINFLQIIETDKEVRSPEDI